MQRALTLLATLAAALVTAAPRSSAAPIQDEPKPEELLIDGDEHQRYLLHGPALEAKAPRDGWRLLVVLPGGGGGADFAPFVGRIRENALGEDWLIAQIVAPVWDEQQAKSLVWPTKLSPWPKMKFTCEELFAAVVKDVAARRELDPRYLFTLSWSSSGPLAYTLALDKDSLVTGSFIAMSVYKPDQLPSLKGAKGQAFYILHSPEDTVCPLSMAEDAHKQLEKAGAEVEFATYAGGHGWRGDVFGNLRTGVEWPERRAKKAKLRKSSR